MTLDLDLGRLAELAWCQFWQVSLLVILVAGLVAVFFRRRPHAAHVLWLLVVVKCLVPPVWSSPTGVFSWAMAPRESAAVGPAVGLGDVNEMGSLEGATSGAGQFTPVVVRKGGQAPLPAPALEENASAEAMEPGPVCSPTASGTMVFTGFAAAWLAGVGVYLAVTGLAGLAWLVRLRRSQVPLDPGLALRVAEIARRLGLRRDVRVRLTSEPIGPAVYGVLRPTLVLPERLVAERPSGELEPILAHELIHVRRWDGLVCLLQWMAQALWWFHPLVWWANRQLSRRREECCDEEVIAGLDCRPSDYAESLLDLLKLRRSLRPRLVFPGARPMEVTLKRLEHIMDRSRKFSTRPPRWCWLVLAVGLATALPGAAMRAADEPGQPEPATPEASQPEDSPAADEGPKGQEPRPAADPFGGEPAPAPLDAARPLGPMGPGTPRGPSPASKSDPSASAPVPGAPAGKGPGSPKSPNPDAAEILKPSELWKNSPVTVQPAKPPAKDPNLLEMLPEGMAPASGPIRPFDLLYIRATGTLLDHPIHGHYLVEPDGQLSLGPAYGRVKLAGATLKEANARCTKQLELVLARPFIKVKRKGRVTRWYRAIVPKGPYRIVVGDTLRIDAIGTLLDLPIRGDYEVEPTGSVDLFYYGDPVVKGQTFDEAGKTIQADLMKILARAEVAVSMADWKIAECLLPRPTDRIVHGDLLQIHVLGTLLDQPICGTFVVEPAGTVQLGPAYGRVEVVGMTMVEAKEAVEDHLRLILARPEASVTPAGWKAVLETRD